MAAAGRNEPGASRSEWLGGVISGRRRGGGRGRGAAAEMCEPLAVAFWLRLVSMMFWWVAALAAACSADVFGVCCACHAVRAVQALERIAGLLEDVAGGSGSLVIAERGDAEGVPRHPAFRLFGAMNPATDAGGCASIDAVGEVQ